MIQLAKIIGTNVANTGLIGAGVGKWSGIRSFSYTGIKLVECENCGKNLLTYTDKKDLSKFAKEYAKENPVPVFNKDQVEKIEKEKPVDLAAAYKDNYEGLKARKEEAIKSFDKIVYIFGEYFTGKHQYAEDKLLEKKENKNVCKDDIDVHMFNSNDEDGFAVKTSNVPDEYRPFRYLSKQGYSLLKKVTNDHEKAETLMRESSGYVEKAGNPDAIDKDFHKEILKVEIPNSQNDSNIPSSSHDTKTENPTATSGTENSTAASGTKRSFEETGESSNDSPDKRPKVDKGSLSYITDMPEDPQKKKQFKQDSSGVVDDGTDMPEYG